MLMSGVYHTPALLTETVDGLNIRPNGVYVDATFGGGGHSRAILQKLGKQGRLISFDQDMDAYANRIDDQRFTFIHGNFRYLKNFLQYHHIEKIDGLLADLGVSFHHFDEADRGFSFRFNALLDMRMNQKSTLSAATVVNTYTEEQLANLFYLYGELRNSRQLARAIVNRRQTAPLETIDNLVTLLQPYMGRDKEKKDLARLFQALRIEVNKEMEALERLLHDSLGVLNEGGRMVVLTYHSLEDRMVKNFFKSGRLDGQVEKDFYGNPIAPIKPLSNKVITATTEEVGRNPRARSAKLRIAVKL